MADRERYAFEGWTLDVSERRLLSAREAITLPPKAYDLLLTLVRNAGHLVAKLELVAEVWSDLGRLHCEKTVIREAQNLEKHRGLWTHTE